MNTVGQILKEARVKKGMSLSRLESITKIKKEFIIKIEKGDWNNLPEFPVVSGFVKNLSSALNLSIDNLNAVLRRDYPPKKLAINPKPDMLNKFSWTPKLTFGVGIGTLIILVMGYLGIEYQKFIKPPELEIFSPKINEVILNKKVKISGKTTTDVSLTANNQLIIVDQNGYFTTELEIDNNTKELKFVAVSRSGKATIKNINISVE